MKKFKGLIGSMIISMLLVMNFCTIALANNSSTSIINLGESFNKVGSISNLAVNKRITILHTNDTHARVMEGQYDGMGFAKLTTLFKQYKAQNPNTLVLDAGDTFHGQTIATLVEGESIAKLMNIMGYDAMTAGNHDFNYGYQQLIKLDGMTNFPILSANLVKKSDGTRILTPYLIKELDGIKIGIMGLSTPETTYKSHPKNVEGLRFIDPVEEAKVMVAELKGKVDVIVALAHLGNDESAQHTSSKLAQAVPEIDLIVDGHSHTTLNNGMLVGNTLIVSAGDYDKNLGTVQLTFEGTKLIAKQATLVSKLETQQIAEDKEVLNFIKEMNTDQELILSKVVGQTPIKLEGAREQVRKGETNLGNLIADAMRSVSGADAAIINGGVIRASIEAGPITKGQIITVLPFGNYIVTKKLKGADIKAALEFGFKVYPKLNAAFPQVSGITYTIDPSMPVGQKVTAILIKGMPLDFNRDYVLAINDFLASGGDGYTMFADAPLVNEYHALDEALISYINSQQAFEIQVGRGITKKSASVIYSVKPGDVLWRIAKQYGTTWEKLQVLNKLKNPHLIFPGQKIILQAD